MNRALHSSHECSVFFSTGYRGTDSSFVDEDEAELLSAVAPMGARPCRAFE
ncbi:MAG: hypothetical protein H0V07_05310 [Propionibacteriales bacterium]|nr:hypothetical protein [Propionibacteriales bacterium]